jgi:hypothetical protein
MPNTIPRANARGLPDDEPRFCIAQLFRDPALRTAFRTAEDGLGPTPLLPKSKIEAAGSDNAQSIFSRAYWAARVVAARHELVEAQFAVGFHDDRGKTSDAVQLTRKISRELLYEALVRLAGLPAMTGCQLEWKKEIIGKIWLRTDSVFREAIARDEAYLRAKASALKEARQ